MINSISLILIVRLNY